MYVVTFHQIQDSSLSHPPRAASRKEAQDLKSVSVDHLAKALNIAKKNKKSTSSNGDFQHFDNNNANPHTTNNSSTKPNHDVPAYVSYAYSDLLLQQHHSLESLRHSAPHSPHE